MRAVEWWGWVGKAGRGGGRGHPDPTQQGPPSTKALTHQYLLNQPGRPFDSGHLLDQARWAFDGHQLFDEAFNGHLHDPLRALDMDDFLNHLAGGRPATVIGGVRPQEGTTQI